MVDLTPGCLCRLIVGGKFKCFTIAIRDAGRCIKLPDDKGITRLVKPGQYWEIDSVCLFYASDDLPALGFHYAQSYQLHPVKPLSKDEEEEAVRAMGINHPDAVPTPG